MRAAISGKPYMIGNESGKVCGVCLGFDFAAEHEWGIEEINRRFKINPKGIGIKRYQTTTSNSDFIYLEEDKNVIMLTFEHRYKDPQTMKDRVCHDLGWQYTKVKEGEQELCAAWDEGSFQVIVSKKACKEWEGIKDVYNALLKKDAAIFISGGSFVDKQGLVIGIVSELPKNVDEDMKESQNQWKEYEAYEKKTGIKEKLEKAGKKWFALRVKNKDEHGVYWWWLNPQEQDDNNYGWYTTEDLEDWANNTGKILKDKAAVK
jgi:hypothetical protein